METVICAYNCAAATNIRKVDIKEHPTIRACRREQNKKIAISLLYAANTTRYAIERQLNNGLVARCIFSIFFDGNE